MMKFGDTVRPLVIKLIIKKARIQVKWGVLIFLVIAIFCDRSIRLYCQNTLLVYSFYLLYLLHFDLTKLLYSKFMYYLLSWSEENINNKYKIYYIIKYCLISFISLKFQSFQLETNLHPHSLFD
jgi:hypothetical protein